MASPIDSKRVRSLVLNAPFRLPFPVQRVVAGKAVVLDGLSLDPQMQIVGRFLGKVARDPKGRDLRAIRAEFNAMSRAIDRPDPPMARIATLSIPGPGGRIPLTIFVPFGAAASAPGVVFFHGGGFAVGSRETHEGLCHRIADGTKAIVVSVEYRLAPENPFPAGVDDAFAAYRWVLDHGAAHGIDATRLGVAGDSAGGCLSAVVSILARDAGVRPPRAQWLIYPLTESGADTPSRRMFSKGFLLDARTIAWFHESYLPDNQVDDFRASPLKTPSLTGLPPAYVSTAGFDPLRDEGEAYAARLTSAGVRTTLRRYDGLIHGFANMRFSKAACDAVDDGIRWLRAELA